MSMHPKKSEPHGVEPETPVKSPNEARQAVTGHNARYVLAWSIGVLVVAFVIVYLVYFA